MGEYTLKQTIVVRKDLKMRKGKIASQVAHASMKVFADRMNWVRKEISGVSKADLLDINRTIQNSVIKQVFECVMTEEMAGWLQGSFAKIVLGCDSVNDIQTLAKLANDNNIPYAVITDNGTTVFHGKETITCIALGPDVSEKIENLTKDFALL